MPARRHKLSLGKRLQSILLAAVLVPSLVVAVMMVRAGAEAEHREAAAVLASQANTVADEAGNYVDDGESILASASIFHAFIDRNKAEQIDTLESILARFSYFHSLSVYYEPSVEYSSVDRDDSAWAPPKAFIGEGFHEAFGSGRYISPVYYTRSHEPAALIMVAIAEPGSSAPVGVVAGVIGLSRLQEIANEFYHVHELDVLIVDQSGRALALPYSYTKCRRGQLLGGKTPMKDLVACADSRGSGSGVTYMDPNKTRVLASYARVGKLGWGVVVQQPLTIVVRPPYRALIAASFWMIGFVLLFAVLGRYVSLRFTRPLARIKEGAEIIGAGNLDYRVNIRTNDELEDVADAFNRTAAQLDASYSELESSHDRAVMTARQAEALYAVAQALVSTLRLTERLDVVAKSLTDVCNTDKSAIWLIRGNVLEPSASFGLTPEEKIAFDSWEVHEEEATGMTRRVIASHKPLVINDAAADPLVPPRVVAVFHFKSILALPLLIEDDVIGYALAYVSDRIREFTDYEVSMASAVTAQAAVAIANAQAYERERRIADTLQRSFLPHVPPRIDTFEIADKYESALTEAEIGGDFYDLVRLSPTRIALVMADISGKGLSAAVHTAMVKYTLRAFALEELNGIDLIRRLNQAVWRFLGGQMFVTLFYGVLDIEKGELAYVNAGHELPFLFSYERQLCSCLETTGTALGIVPDYEFGEKHIAFGYGDSLLLYTDGATDVRREGAFLGEDGLEGIFCGAASGTAHEIVNAVDAGIREYSGGQLHDDVALMVIKCHGGAAEAAD